MTPAELNRELESDRFRPLYYFFGEEDYRVKEAEKALVKRFLPKSQWSTGHETLSAGKLAFDDILMELSIVPMLGERQVFTISEVQALSQKEAEKVLSLTTPPDPNRVVILVRPSAKAPRKDEKLHNFLIQKTTAVKFDHLTEQNAERRIFSTLSENDISLDADAEELLLMLTGGDYGGLAEELNKLVSYVGNGGKVTREVVAQVCSNYQSFRVWDLADYAARGELDKALEVTRILLGEGEKESGILFWISEHFVELYLVKNGKPLSGWKKWQTAKYQKQGYLYDNQQLEDIIELIAEADFDLRNQIRPESLIIERLILQICRLRKTKVAP